MKNTNSSLVWLARHAGSSAAALRKKLRGSTLSSLERTTLEQIDKDFPRVLSTRETLELIVRNKASICRFGDAEFDISSFEKKNDPYQQPSKVLSQRLHEILLTPSVNNLIVAIPPFNSAYNNTLNFYKDISFWEWYWMKRYNKLSPYLTSDWYGNSFVSRDAVFYENNLASIKKLWEGRKTVFVVGKHGRFIFEPRLFSNLIENGRVYVPATNAFEDYGRIKKECFAFSLDHLFLIAAGPTAAVLAYDLHAAGYQAIDMGHISNCYLQFMGEAQAPETLPMNSVA
jgi:glycosyltransferase family protein